MTIVRTVAGQVRGAEIADGILAWTGIPYAAPPVGPLRFRLPEPAEPWSGVRDATAYGAPAVQPPSMMPPMAGLTLPEPSEDCLYLNITAPAGASGRPVIMWLHGGGYQTGSGTDMATGGSSFARSHGVLVVTFNYRLGALGFLALDGETHTGAYGLHDQIAALRWVRENISAFGGDPGQITVYGLSAGAKSVANLLGSPLTGGLIHRAASSSGGADHVATPQQASSLARRFLRELGAAPAGARQAPAGEILAAQRAIGEGLRATFIWRPALDGLALSARPLDAIAAGAAGGIPLLAQTCAEECAIYQAGAPDAAAQADRVLDEHFGPAARDEILTAYARSRPELAGDPERLRVAVMTDERYGIPTARLADAQSAHAAVWRSRYDGPITIPPGLGLPAGPAPAFHGTDGPPIWNGSGGLAQILHEVWGQFATGNHPSAAGLPAWPRYDPGHRTTMIFDEGGSRTADDPRGAERAAWDGREWQSGTWWRFPGSD
jgi:para-nitrobenzyl esterase